jgi:hypothetical protein
MQTDLICLHNRRARVDFGPTLIKSPLVIVRNELLPDYLKALPVMDRTIRTF